MEQPLQRVVLPVVRSNESVFSQLVDRVPIAYMNKTDALIPAFQGELPRAVAGFPKPASTAPDTFYSAGSGGKQVASVIVVEDEEEFRTYLSEVLTYAGFAIIDADTADSAADLLKEQPDIQLLVTDIDLPGKLDGVALANVARRSNPDMPVIFISGQPMRLREAWALEGPTAFFHKPFSFNMLLSAAQGFLHQGRQTMNVVEPCAL